MYHTGKRLVYVATVLRPDILIEVNSFSQHVESASKIHWNAVKIIMKYSKGTMKTSKRIVKQTLQTTKILFGFIINLGYVPIF